MNQPLVDLVTFLKEANRLEKCVDRQLFMEIMIKTAFAVSHAYDDGHNQGILSTKRR